jgi:hypothetical protein
MVICFCVVLSCVGRGLCDGLITRLKESYQMSKNRLRNLRCEAAKVLAKNVEPIMITMMTECKSITRTE